MNKKRITILVGAGAAIEIGGPSTFELTQKVIKTKIDLIHYKSGVLESIYKIISNYYHPDTINFEHIMHALEMLTTYNSYFTDPESCKISLYKPLFAPFIKPRYKRFFKGNNDISIQLAKTYLIEAVADEVNKYNEAFAKAKSEHFWYQNFWNTPGINWDITTLNYDTTIEHSLSKRAEDGFEPNRNNYINKDCSNVKALSRDEIDALSFRFNPTRLTTQSKEVVVNHLHGCICFGHSWRSKNIYEDETFGIVKFQSYDLAKRTWSSNSGKTQAAEDVSRGPIITGLRKTEKITTYPYSFYQYYLQDSIIKNNSLLIVGYSFGDLYLNEIIDRISRIHGEKKRIVIITYYGKEYWSDNHSINDFFDHNEAYMFYAKACSDNYPLKGHKEKDFFDKKPLRARNGKVLIFLHGFKDAVENHKELIIDFLLS